MDDFRICLIRIQQISKEWNSINKALGQAPWEFELWAVLIRMATDMRGYEPADFCEASDLLMEAGFQSPAQAIFHFIDLNCQNSRGEAGESSPAREQFLEATVSLLAVVSETGEQVKVLNGIVLLGDENRWVRSRAAKLLGDIGDAAAVTALSRAVGGDDYVNVRRYGVTALGKIGDAEAVPALIQALSDEDQAVRDKAARALPQVVDDSSIPALANAVSQEDRYVCREAAAALGTVQDVSALPSLVKILGHDDDQVRATAAAALGRIGDPAAVPELITILNDEEGQVRKAGADALGAVGDKSAVPALLALLNDEESDVRASAVSALGELTDPAAVSDLCGALDDKNSSVRRKTAMALGNIGDETAVPALVAALEDKEWLVRVEIVRAVGKLSSDLVPSDYHLCYQRIDMIAESEEWAAVNRKITGTSWEEIIWSALLQVCEWNKYAGRTRLCADVNGLIAIGYYSPAAAEFRKFDQRCQQKAQIAAGLPRPTAGEMATTIGWLKSVILAGPGVTSEKGGSPKGQDLPPATIPFGHWPEGDTTIAAHESDTMFAPSPPPGPEPAHREAPSQKDTPAEAAGESEQPAPPDEKELDQDDATYVYRPPDDTAEDR